MSFRHGLVQYDGGPFLRYSEVGDILSSVLDFCDTLTQDHFDLGLDWAEKMYDMAGTAITAIRWEKAYSSGDSLKTALIPLVYQVLGLFLKHDKTQRRLLPQLIKSLATV